MPIGLVGRIPVYVNEQLVERCDHSRAQQLAMAPNVKAIRCRRSKEITRLNVTPVADDTKERSLGSPDVKTTYSERIDGGREMVILKRFDEKTGRLVCWSDRDGFSIHPFNTISARLNVRR